MRPAAICCCILWFFVCSLTAHADCVFDSNFFTEGTYQNNALVKSVVWLKQENEAKIITARDDLISIKHWSCNTAGLSAVMLIHPDVKSEQAKAKLLELGRIVLQGTELADFIADVQKRPTDFDKVHNIGGPENRPVFFYVLRRFSGYLTAEIQYYYN